MISISINPQRNVFPGVIKALQRLQEDPQQLARERDQRYNELPLPPSDSGETTLPPSPGSLVVPVVDMTRQRDARRRARYKATAFCQFQSQARRESERIFHQLSGDLSGRRQTLPFDYSMDYQANAENNVRSRWIEQGIWKEEWGQAWLKGSHPSSRKGCPRGGPFYNSYSTINSRPRSYFRWGHEKFDLESELRPGSMTETESQPNLQIFGTGAGQPEQPEPTPQPIKYNRPPLGSVPQRPILKPTVRNPEASRPYHQFRYQVSKEHDWIKDEVDHKSPEKAVDLDVMAYESVKNNWIEDGIWNPKWGKFPGMTWIHEEPEEEEPVKASVASDSAGGQSLNAVHGIQKPCAPQYPTDLVNDDCTNNNSLIVAKTGDVTQKQVDREEREIAKCQPTPIEGTDDSGGGLSRLFRSTRSSKQELSPEIEDMSCRIRSGRIEKNATQSTMISRRGTQSRHSTLAVAELAASNRRSNKLKAAADWSHNIYTGSTQPQRQSRRSRRLARQQPELGMLQ